jgi:hypothetical protein
MTSAVWIYSAICIIVAGVVVVVCVIQRIRLAREWSLRRIAELWPLTGSDPLGEPGVSLLVDWDGNESSLEQLLTLDYLRYEVIVVGNIQSNIKLARLAERYAMIEMGAPVIEESLRHSPRRLYRSRRRSYRRLLVVDTGAEAVAERMDCALAVRSYDFVVALERGVRLSADALRVLVWQACDTSAKVVCATLGAGRGVSGFLTEIWNFMGWQQGCIALMDGDSVIAAGGFSAAHRRHPKLTPHTVRHLASHGAHVSRMTLGVGRKESLHPPLSVIDWVVWHCLSTGVVLWVLGSGEERQVVVLCLAVLWLAGVVAAVGTQAYCRVSGSRHKWWMCPIVMLALPFRIIMPQDRKKT